ncbi:MAG: phosphoglucosamine mutase [Deltaproteobacteria bacterium]|nr:phosphoglucosamine mutase [Deltaproteobacteria bacterium]
MSALIISYSGLRGIAGESLTEGVAERYGAAFGQMIVEPERKPTVLVARDTRPSGPALMRGLLRGLAPYATLVDLGVAATPTLQHAIGSLVADAGVCVTASHNPSQWNGLKLFLGTPSVVLGGDDMKRLTQLAERAVENPHAPAPPVTDRHEAAIERHIAAVLAAVDVVKIKERRFRVAVDSAGGAGDILAQRLLARLGCHVVRVEAGRESEPIPANLRALADAVAAEKCDLGFAQDLDADRLALATEWGDLPGEDSTLVLTVDHLLRRHASGDRVVVKNVATTRAIDDIAAAHGAALVETKVGEINLSRALISATDAGKIAFGGEGNGGVIYPKILYGRDSAIGMALVLEALATENEPLSKRLQALPQYHMVKTKMPLGSDLRALLARVEALFEGAAADRSDGLKLRFTDGAWIVVRASNTEPVVRVIVEAKDKGWAERAVARILAL